MAVLATVKPTINGVLLAAVAAAAGGDQIVNPNGNVILYVKNGGASAINVTVDAAALQGGLSFVDPVIAVAAGAERLIGPFDPRFFNDATGSQYHLLSSDNSNCCGRTSRIIEAEARSNELDTR